MNVFDTVKAGACLIRMKTEARRHRADVNGRIKKIKEILNGINEDQADYERDMNQTITEIEEILKEAAAPCPDQ